MATLDNTWLPEPGSLSRPVYLSLVEQVVHAIDAGDLVEGSRLPTHRDLSAHLGISAQTVSRAYEELVRRGIISSSVGRGTFVAKSAIDKPAYPHIPDRSQEVVDLSILKPASDSLHLEKLSEALVNLARDLPVSSAFSFRPNVALAQHRSMGAQWLRSYGVNVEEQNLLVTNGATPGMTLALMSALSPGSTLLSEEIGHHTLKPLTAYLGANLQTLKSDEQGLSPESLERASSAEGVKALFIMPGPISPNVTVMPNERRLEIVEIARRKGILIIENDPLGALVEGDLTPFVNLAPERTFYVTSFTKSIMPGLRIGYVAAPSSLIPAATNRSLVTTWMATPLMADIASRWVADGTVSMLLDWQRKELRKRHQLARECLGGIRYSSHPQSLHLWLPLDAGHSEDAFISNVRLRNVGIARGSAFALGPQPHRPAVRISVGSTSLDDLRFGLEIIASVFKELPEPVLPAL